MDSTYTVTETNDADFSFGTPANGIRTGLVPGNPTTTEATFSNTVNLGSIKVVKTLIGGFDGIFVFHVEKDNENSWISPRSLSYNHQLKSIETGIFNKNNKFIQ